MTDEAKVVRDLRTAGAKYMDSAKTDIMNALRVYKELRSDVEHNFQYPDMKRRNAFKLIGTIPITYRVCFWKTLFYIFSQEAVLFLEFSFCFIFKKI